MQCKSCSGLMLEWERGRFVAPRHGLGGSINVDSSHATQQPTAPYCAVLHATDGP